jgi:two-component SAPR family response regulator
MLIFVLDDEALLLETELRMIRQVRPDAELCGFQRAQEALDWVQAQGRGPDIVFCDIQMPGLSGLEFAVRLRQLSPATKVIFVTGYDQYAMDAFRIHAHGYVLKPLSPERVEEELAFWCQSSAAVPEEGPVPEGNKLRARCFGSFEVFWQDKPLSFDRRKTKELLAYLIDREGAFCTAEEISTALWEEEWDMKLTKNRIRVLVSDLKTNLDRFDLGELLIRRSGLLAVRRDLLDCDYYRMLDGDPDALNSFDGQYMQQYPWAELTSGRLYFRYIDSN